MFQKLQFLNRKPYPPLAHLELVNIYLSRNNTMKNIKERGGGEYRPRILKFKKKKRIIFVI